MCDWEVKIGSEWVLLGVAEFRALEKLELTRTRVGRAKLRDQEYEYDIVAMTHHHLNSGIIREMRRVDKRTKEDDAASKLEEPDDPSEPEEPVEVQLHVYDVGINSRVAIANGVLRIMGTGAYHTGVEIHGLEWSYAKREFGTGVFWCEPKKCGLHQYRESIPLGFARISLAEVDELLDNLADQWQGMDYDPFSRNCNGFSNELVQQLGLGAIPNWVMNLAGAGATVNDIVAKGIESRGDRSPRGGAEGIALDCYRYGDVARGLAAIGKEERGVEITAEPVFGDYSRGLLRICCTSRTKEQSSPRDMMPEGGRCERRITS